jgi:hypothetical protein
MGQAGVELADPLQSPPPPQAAGADDLLAQMAGAEIDRLLAEAEADIAPLEKPQSADEAAMALAFGAAAVETAPPTDSKPTTEETLAGELDTLLTSLTSAREPKADAPVAPEQQQIDEPPPAVSAAETAALLPGADQSLATSADVALEATEETSAAERQALHDAAASAPIATEEAVDNAVAAVAEAVTADPEPEATEDGSLPLWLRPLEWLNVPIADCSDLVREFIGKAAILTVVNALALIVYVRFIRRH